MSGRATNWAENLDISDEAAARSVHETAEALQALLPWPLVQPLAEDLHKDFERLHAHMRLMLVQALESPRPSGRFLDALLAYTLVVIGAKVSQRRGPAV